MRHRGHSGLKCNYNRNLGWLLGGTGLLPGPSKPSGKSIGWMLTDYQLIS